MTADIFNPVTIQHPLVIVGAAALFSFLAKDFKHALIQSLAMLLLMLVLVNHWA